MIRPLKNALFITTLATAVLGPALIWRETRMEIEALRGKIAQQSDELKKFRRDCAALSSAVQNGSPQKRLSTEQFTELLRTRGAMSEFKRNHAAETAKDAEPFADDGKTESLPPDAIARDSYRNAGHASPSATAQTLLWALAQGNIAVYLDCLSSQYRKTHEEWLEDVPAGKMPGAWRSSETGARLLEQRQTPEGEMIVKVFLHGIDAVEFQRFARFGDSWKLTGGAAREDFVKATPASMN